jgi:hypothetical protein
MPTTSFNTIGIPEELLNLRRAATASQVAARREADYAMDEKYAGNYVAYIDNWSEDKLERTIVAFATEVAAFQDKLAQLPQEIRTRVQLTQIPEADTFSAPSVWLT